VWILFLTIIVIKRWYEYFNPNDYIFIGLGISLPCIVGPLLLADKDERRLPLSERYIIKANLFIFIVGYIGNHFFTHYFYDVLGMQYTGPLAPGKGLEINGVPLSMFLFTHAYFMTYHVLVTLVLRVARLCLQGCSCWYMHSLFAIIVVVTAFVTAFMETYTISGFPYYTYPDLGSMLTKGSAFYGTFFVVTYPWFYRLDEDPKDLWTLSRVIMEALAAMMVVLLSADFLKLVLKACKP